MCKEIEATSISFFQKKANGSFSFTNCTYTYAAHNGICIKINWTRLNDSSYFSSSGSLRTVIFTYDMYTNNRCYSLCWQLLLSCEFFNIFVYSRSLDSVTNLAARFYTLFSFSRLHIGVPNQSALLQDWMHQSFISCSFNILMHSRTCWSIISFEGEIGSEANDLVNCIPESGPIG